MVGEIWRGEGVRVTQLGNVMPAVEGQTRVIIIEGLAFYCVEGMKESEGAIFC